MLNSFKPYLILPTCLISFVIFVGCPSGSDKDSTNQNRVDEGTTNPAQPKTSEQGFKQAAENLFRQQKLDDAAEAISKCLIRDPNDDSAKYLAARIEAARGNLETAVEFAETIDGKSSFASSAVELQYKLLAQLGRHNDSANMILAALKNRQSGNTQFRHDAWQLLNLVGRREEASEQAEKLCRQGSASDDELLSLVGRTQTYPLPGMLADNDAAKFKLDGHKRFGDGLGKARWYFSVNEFQQALDQLADEYENGFQSSASEALYGRLLAEIQAWDKFPIWNASIKEDTKALGDYWAALGTFFIDHKKNEAAAAALLKAVHINPTDIISVQRLSRVFSALDRADDAEQFQRRGIELVESIESAAIIFKKRNSRDARITLAKKLMELERPFEALGWTETTIPPGSAGPRQAISQQRTQLLKDPTALTMAREAALLQLDPDDFDIQPAWEELLANAASRQTDSGDKIKRRDILATPKLVNVAKETGLEFQWYKDVEIDLTSIPIHESLGGGITAIDFDLDGWPDVYFCQGAGDPPTDQCTRSSQLFRNVDSSFAEVTTLAAAEDFNYSSGIAAGDINQDGFPDLFLGSLGHNRILINNGDGSFRDSTLSLGEFDDRFTSSIAIGDINDDGLPDLFEANYIEMEGGFVLPKKNSKGVLTAPTPLRHYAESDRWFENLGDGSFQIHEITRSVAKPGTSLGLVITDFDSDGKNEVFVGIDVRPNHFLVQRGKNEFVNIANTNGLANGFDGIPNGCMGIATGDFNRDGRIDMQIANYSLEPANLFLQSDAGDYTDFARRYGVASATHPNVGFGTKALDIDHNGFQDFIVTNGHIFDMRPLGEPYQMAPQLLMSTGDEFVETDVEDESGYWSSKFLGRAVTMIDYDRDNAIDFLIGHIDQPSALLRNETTAKGDTVMIELIGTKSDRDAVGTKVVVSTDQGTYTDWATGGDGYFSSDESVLTFALPNGESAEKLQVHWPSGHSQEFEIPGGSGRFLAVEGQINLDPRSKKP